MALLIDQLLLLASIAALGAAGWRLAAAATPSGLLRVVAAVPLAAAGAVLSALALALVGLGASPVALTAAAVAIWLGCLRSVAVRPPAAGEQLGAWWASLSPPGRVARLALAGAVIGYGAWVLRHPSLGYDALTYHLALPVAWIQNGRPGSLVSVWDGLPIQNYPLTWEVLVSWVTGIARTFVPATLLTPASLLLLAVSVRAGMRELGVSSRLAWLAAAVAAAMPIGVVQLPGPNNDLPDTAWLACAAALAAGAAPWREREGERHGGLLAVALVAAALCLGTKTTGAPLAAVAIAGGAWRCRRELRRVVLPLVVAVAVGVVVGGIWYLRNLFDHGAPFWPLSTTSWGDPIPAAFHGAVHASLLSHVRATLHGRVHDYWRVLAGGVVVFVGALVAPLWARRWDVVWGAVLVLASLLLWAASPYTGDAANTALAVGATRYVLPCLVAAVVTVALAGRGGGRLEVLPGAVLLGALAVNVDRDATLGFPYAPSARTLLIAAVLGALVGLVVELMGRAGAARAQARLTRWSAAALGGVLAAVLLLALLVPADGYLAAHAKTGQFDAAVVRYLEAHQSFRDGRRPVLVGPVSIAVLTGSRLVHRLTVLPAGDRCPVLAHQALSAWVVMETAFADLRYDRHWITCLGGRPHVVIEPSFLVYPPPGSD